VAEVTQTSTVDEVGKFFWNFLKTELSPYPGRAWVVGRVTIAATIVMVVIMTFRIPLGYQGAIFTLFLTRENPTATFRAGLNTVLGFLAGTAYALLSVMLMIDDPITHFLWVAISLFISFYLLHTIADYGTAVAFGFMVAGSIILWDETTLNVNTRVEDTLWLSGVVAIGVVVTIVVEFVFRRIHPATDLNEGIEQRLKVVEHFLRSTAANQPLDPQADKNLTLYSTVGTSRLRRLINRSEFSAHFKAQMSTAIALVGRLVDTAGSFRLALAERGTPIVPADQERCNRLADEIHELSVDLTLRKLPGKFRPPSEEPTSLPFLATMERAVAYIPGAFAGSDSVHEFVTAPLDEEGGPAPLFVSDAFSNPAHLQFALRGTLAAMACYITYTAIDWRGLSTSVPTCFITALTTVGSSRQKQILRLAGAITGGFIFGMGAQIFVLPYLDSIAGFALFFALVTAISAWIGSASARLSYLGVQLALAYYLINLQEFTIQTSLAIARDRVFGVLLGLMAMWLIFDRLWVRNALDEMQAVFARNLEMFAQLAEELLDPDQVHAILRIRQLRDRINAGFEGVRAQSDAILFEFGSERQRKLQIRDDIRRWQPSIRTLLQVQVTSAQYLLYKPLKDMPRPIAEAGVVFEKDIAVVMRAMANVVTGKPVGMVPDIRLSATRMREAIRSYYQGMGAPISDESTDVMGLADSLATILAPLYDDIRDTFAAQRQNTVARPQLAPGQA
jgi:multidrug resistance protein MdtO